MTALQTHPSVTPAATGAPVDRPSLRARWPAWVGYAAAAWSLLYGILGLYWMFGGAGFPFGTEQDPHAARVSILEHARRETAAPLIAGLGLGGALLAVAMARGRRRGALGPTLLGLAWTAAVALAVVIPDHRSLMAVARAPIVLVGRPFGWPEGVSIFGPGMFAWPVVNQIVLILGGLLWAATAVAYRRRIRDACGACGRTGAQATWTTPANAARWGRWAVVIAIVIPGLYALTRWAWALGIPLGITREMLREEARDTPDIWLAGALLASVAVAGALLTLGLIQHWGEVYPRWIPFLGGRPVRPRTAIIPASLVAVLVTTAGLHAVRAQVLGYYPKGAGLGGENWGATAPGLLWPLWGAALGAATYAYYLRRRGRCNRCGRGDARMDATTQVSPRHHRRAQHEDSAAYRMQLWRRAAVAAAVSVLAVLTLIMGQPNAATISASRQVTTGIGQGTLDEPTVAGRRPYPAMEDPMTSKTRGSAASRCGLLGGCEVIGTALLAATTPGQGTAGALAFDPSAIDRFVTGRMNANRIPGLALAITRGDEVLYVRGYGAARAGEPVTGQTQFLVASLSKSFTALAVLQLVEAGRVELDAPVRRYLPEFTLADPEAAARITVRQLLNQVGGLADTGFAGGLARQQPTLAARVASLRSARPVSAPGEAFHYSDPNYQVLARLVEVVSGESFDAYLQAHVFAPLEMHDTFSAVTTDEAVARAERLAEGHLVIYGLPVAARELPGVLGGSSGVVSTAADLARYLAMQNAGGRYAGRTLLSREHRDLTHTPPAGVASRYGMGWFAGTSRGVRTVEHNGVLSTFYAEAVLLPDSGYGFVLLYNEYALTSAALAFPALKDGLVALLSGQEPPDGALTVPALGAILAALTALSIGLAALGLLRLPRWAAALPSLPRWRLALGIAWAFTPGLLLLALPQLLAQFSGRYFGHVMLARAMPELVICLGACGGLGALTGTARLIILARRARAGRRARPHGWPRVPHRRSEGGRKGERVMRVEVSTPVKAPPAIVSAVYADYANWPRLFPTIRGVRLIRRTGAQFLLEIDHVEGKVMNELFARSPDEIDLRETKRHYDAVFRNRFEAASGGTRFTVRGEVSLKGAARVLRPFLSGYARRMLERLQVRPVKAEAERRARLVAAAPTLGGGGTAPGRPA